MHIQGSPDEIEAPTHWNLISHSMTVPLRVITQQYCSATIISFFLPSHKEKHMVCISEMLLFKYLYFL
jgi:hypothetical protein